MSQPDPEPAEGAKRPVARLEGVTKTYHLGLERSNWRALIPGPRGEVVRGESFQALADVSLTIEPGQALGIIGANGAGKSTVLKLLAGVVEPTSGTVEVNGDVAPVIELGVGFDPDLSGADNLRFGATLLGHSNAEITERWDDIVAFAGLADFMSTPLKRYSTGMRARLGFSLVTAFPTDLILLDEVLAVGDWAFQRRSLARIRELHAAGSAIVAVSHSNWMLAQLCDTLILLEHGHVIASGDSVTVIGRYLGEEVVGVGEPFPDDQIVADLIPPPPESSPVSIEGLAVIPNSIEPAAPVRFSFELVVEEGTEGILVMSFYTIGRAAFAEPEEGPSHLLATPGRWRIEGTITSLPVGPGPYHLRVAVIPAHDPDDFDHEFRNSLAVETVPFAVLGNPTRRPGILLEVTWVEEDVLAGPGRTDPHAGAGTTDHPSGASID